MTERRPRKKAFYQRLKRKDFVLKSSVARHDFFPMKALRKSADSPRSEGGPGAPLHICHFAVTEPSAAIGKRHPRSGGVGLS
ncbi:MAG: hypothetical protein ACOC05_01915 [Oceanicaulis sp.]